MIKMVETYLDFSIVYWPDFIPVVEYVLENLFFSALLKNLIFGFFVEKSWGHMWSKSTTVQVIKIIIILIKVNKSCNSL